MGDKRWKVNSLTVKHFGRFSPSDFAESSCEGHPETWILWRLLAMVSAQKTSMRGTIRLPQFCIFQVSQHIQRISKTAWMVSNVSQILTSEIIAVFSRGLHHQLKKGSFQPAIRRLANTFLAHSKGTIWSWRSSCFDCTHGINVANADEGCGDISNVFLGLLWWLGWCWWWWCFVMNKNGKTWQNKKCTDIFDVNNPAYSQLTFWDCDRPSESDPRRQQSWGLPPLEWEWTSCVYGTPLHVAPYFPGAQPF